MESVGSMLLHERTPMVVSAALKIDKLILAVERHGSKIEYSIVYRYWRWRAYCTRNPDKSKGDIRMQTATLVFAVEMFWRFYLSGRDEGSYQT
jgi:hypothetical protein